MPFSSKLKELRESKGLSQEELAAKLNIPRSSITHYENHNDRLPRKSRLIEIADFFNVSIDYLLSDTNVELRPNINEKSDNENNLEKALNDPKLGLWFKDIQDASLEKQEELKRFWEFIKEKEKNRKSGDLQK
ncbi:helix-turn-helix domain-containing protein [Bacillus cereus group sp. RP43]|uniref:helix-turn-helix domain-containing protein n=1 Tax=Bacillus cereus group sp. RP43 TaxID=3040260 RepID=UPI00339B8023